MAAVTEADHSVKQTVSIERKHESISKKNSAPEIENTNHLIDALKEGPRKGLVQLKNSFRTLSSTPRRPIEKDKNEPSRFLGEGVSYKAKLIGILEVGEARGDRMCQEALADLKMAIRAAGEHKQRITINIAIDGLRLRDEKNGECLYHHPVHKISFIAQDITDSRAFGYIFGSPDTGHRFFGIKTDKAASQVVITMRDLFQVVFELKKKEVEMAKQHLEQHQIKLVSYPLLDSSSGSKSSSTDVSRMKTIRESDSSKKSEPIASNSKSIATSDAIADLLDLEIELSSIQQGISQMEKLTPSDPFGPSAAGREDPFGDSFSPPPVTSPQPNKLPPPPSKLDKSDSIRSSDSSHKSSISKMQPDKHWFDKETEDIFESTDFPSTTSNNSSTAPTSTASAPIAKEESLDEPVSVSRSPPKSSRLIDVFTELDPLGTGRSKPYVDKKDFFQDLKNPPKKVLKDLVPELSADLIKQFEKNSDAPLSATISENKGPASNTPSSKGSTSNFQGNVFFEDPFNKSDPFEDSFSKSSGFASFSSETCDPFDNFADFSSFNDTPDSVPQKPNQSFYSNESQTGPLRVTLPPEKQSSESQSSVRSRQSSLSRQPYSGGLVKIPSPKQKPRSRLSKQVTVESTVDRTKTEKLGEVSKNRSLGTPSPTSFTAQAEEIDEKSNETAPEPPPRPTANLTFIKPPPLPPKKQQNMSIMKPPPRPPYSDLSHYDYIENYGTSIAPQPTADEKSPPVPVPARRPRFGAPTNNAPERPKKQQSGNVDSDYYLTPFHLLPPPLKKPAKTNTTSSAPKSLDITLSQLTTTGFSELAEWLNMSPVALSKMTMQELFTLLSSMNQSQSNDVVNGSTVNVDAKSNTTMHREKKTSASESQTKTNVSTSAGINSTPQPPPFVADFDSKFNNISKPEDPFQDDTLFDKYAVFRELLEQEKTKQEVNNVDKKVDIQSESPIPEKSSAPPKSDVTTFKAKISEPQSEDRYAALRDIFLEEAEDRQECSDKDESLSDQNNGQGEEHMDLLTLSRQQSESTESPSATIREPQSIMETTIMEEDIIDDENDDVDEEEEAILERKVELKEPLDKPMKPILSPSNLKSTKSDKSISFSDDNFRKSLEDLKINKEDNIFEKAWEKFNSKEPEFNDSGSVNKSTSPWSVDTDDGSKRSQSPSWKGDVSSKHWKNKRHKTPKNWQEDDESDVVDRGSSSREESPWRENGWSNGDETPSYHQDRYPRKDKRRRNYPRRMPSKEPWDDTREYPEEIYQSRPKYRSSSREDDRRKAEYEYWKKRSSPWSSKSDKRSSRESLNHDDDRYPKKSFGDRRRKRWEEHNYPRSDRKGHYYRERDRDRDRSQESLWDDEFSEPGDDELPRSSGRKPNWRSGRHYYPEPDEDYVRRPRKPYSHDEQSESESEFSQQSRKFQTLQLKRVSKSRRRNQNSPFEDEFSPQSFSYPASCRSPNIGSDQSENKLSPRQDFNSTSSEMSAFKWKEDRLSVPYHKADKLSDESEELNQGKLQRHPSQRQSPFEDNFTPPDTRRCSGRSVSSDVSRDEDLKNGDDVFLSAGEASVQANSSKSKFSDPKRACEKTEKIGSKLRESSEIQSEDLRKKRLGRQSSIELKSRISQLRNQNESMSSLKKSDSINIFARSNDPFDDDDFFNAEKAHATIHEEEPIDKAEGDKSAVSFKWTQDFNSFNFSDENK
nr:PREDICTED: protein disabled isoform X1 [Bemisia tabaci]